MTSIDWANIVSVLANSHINIESQTLIKVVKIVFYSLTFMVIITVAGAIVVAELFKGRLLSLLIGKKVKNKKRDKE